MKIFLVALLLVANSGWLAAQNLDDYHPRGNNPDVYNTNPDHVTQARNTHPQDPQHKNWRATCWEIHPITSIRVLSGPPAGSPNPQPPRRVHRGA